MLHNAIQSTPETYQLKFAITHKRYADNGISAAALDKQHDARNNTWLPNNYIATRQRGSKNYLGKLRTCVMPGLPQMCMV